MSLATYQMTNSQKPIRKKITPILITFSIFLTIIFISVPEYNKQKVFDQLYQFPFLASVWGTFSDWATVLVTSLTAIYIYRTLTSQKEVGKQQLITTRIALDQHRLSIIPRIVLDQDITHNGITDAEFYAGNYKGRTKLYSIGHLAKNIKLIIYQGALDDANRTIILDDGISELDNRKFHAFDYKFSQKLGNTDDRMFELYWTYEDIFGNLYYSKMVKYYSFDPYEVKVKINIDIPTLVKLAV